MIIHFGCRIWIWVLTIWHQPAPWKWKSISLKLMNLIVVHVLNTSFTVTFNSFSSCTSLSMLLYESQATSPLWHSSTVHQQSPLPSFSLNSSLITHWIYWINMSESKLSWNEAIFVDRIMNWINFWIQAQWWTTIMTI